MAELMLRPGWPTTFRRTVKTGKKSKVLKFHPGQPVEVTNEELAQLADDLGISIFEVERDEKGRPRYIETVLPKTHAETVASD